MSQKIALHALVYVSGVMAGVLVESRVFHLYRVSTVAAAVVDTASTPVENNTPAQSVPRNLSKATISVEDPNYDFGTAETGTRVEHVFVIKNVGADPLVIHQVQSGCGCTTANLANKEIAPGGSTDLKAIFDLTGRVGKQSSPITIVSNDVRQGHFKISLNGEVTSRVTIKPTSADLGRVKESGSSKPFTVQIQISSGSPLNILKTETTDPAITAQVEELSPGSSYRVYISAASGAPPGPLRSQVRLLTDSAAPYHQLLVPVHGYVGPGGPVLMGDELEISGPTIGGGRADLKSLRGKVCVVVFWASWCGHCQAEMPELVNLYKLHQSDGLEILGVNNDTSMEKAVTTLEKYKVPWPNISFAGDRQGDQTNPLFTKHGISGIPATFVIGRDGRVVSIGLRKAALKLRVEHLLKMEGVAAIQ